MTMEKTEATGRSPEGGRIRDVLDLLPMGCFLLDREGRILLANRALAGRLGRSPEEMEGGTLRELAHDEDRQSVDGLLERRLLGEGGSRDVRLEPGTGKPVAFRLLVASGTADDEGIPVAAIVADPDSEGGDERLRVLALRLATIEDRERERLARILHDDVQQLQAAARFRLSGLRADVEDDPERARRIGEVEEILEEARRKTQNLSHDLRPSVLSWGTPAAVIDWLAQDVRAKHGLEVRVSADEDVPELTEDGRRFLFAAVRELLFNVVKHAETDRARVELRGTGTGIRVAVSDEGKGFDPTPEEEASTRHLGLFGVGEAIRLLGGRMRIESGAGGGSRILLELPGAEGRPEDEPAEPSGEPPPGRAASEESSPADPVNSGNPGNPRIRILVADDHGLIREGIVSLLEEEDDLEVVAEAENGREAVDRARELRPDVVLLDVFMPRMDGIHVATAIRREAPDVRIIGMTTEEDAGVSMKMMDAGAEAVLWKSRSFENLLEVIRGGEPGR